MKKALLLLGLTASMLLATASASLAMAAYAEGTVFGTSGVQLYSTNKHECNFNNLIVGLDCSLTSDVKFKVEGFFGSNRNNNEQTGDNDKSFPYYGFEAKGGYRVLNTNGFMLTPTLSFLYEDYNNKGKTNHCTASGFLLGADASFEVSKTDMIEGSFGFSLFGKATTQADQQKTLDAKLLAAKVRWSHDFTDSLAGTIGYRYYTSNADGENNNKLNFLQSGVTLGVRYTF